MSSDYLQECRNHHTNTSLWTSCQTWALPGFSWVTNKDRSYEEPQQLLASSKVCSRCSSRDDNRGETAQPEDGHLSEIETRPRRFHHHRDEVQEGRRFKHHRALNLASGFHGEPILNSKVPSITRCLKSAVATEKILPTDSFTSQVPLRLQIKVSGQRGSLGISIAGGKGSLPYRDHDEGVFISRVTKGGPSEKAGVHVGDRLMEVNGLSMQGATHLEAVSILRNAGSCIRMKVLRERRLPLEMCVPEVHHVPPDIARSEDSRGPRISQPEVDTPQQCLPKKIEAVVCNGSDTPDLVIDLNRTASKLEAEAFIKNKSLQEEKHTMPIPRIILTHPSTSDEDVELLTQIPHRPLFHDVDTSVKCVHHDCGDSAFYSP